MRTKLLMLFAVLGLMLTQSIYAQPKIVTGTVTDATTNETLPGVNVIIKNTTTGTSTDPNGNYSIRAEQGQVLIFSSLGYATREMTVGSGTRYSAATGRGHSWNVVFFTTQKLINIFQDRPPVIIHPCRSPGRGFFTNFKYNAS